jgi:hypothetical protein
MLYFTKYGKLYLNESEHTVTVSFESEEDAEIISDTIVKIEEIQKTRTIVYGFIMELPSGNFVVILYDRDVIFKGGIHDIGEGMQKDYPNSILLLEPRRFEPIDNCYSINQRLIYWFASSVSERMGGGEIQVVYVKED